MPGFDTACDELFCAEGALMQLTVNPWPLGTALVMHMFVQSVVNQFEYHACLQQPELCAFCSECIWHQMRPLLLARSAVLVCWC